MKKYFLNKMSTGKRLAKRSIIGTRVCAPGADGIWYSGVIQAVKTPPSANQKDNTNCINLTPHTRYSVRFDSKQDISRRGLAREFRESELIGPGFKTIMDVRLKPGQKVFLTYNGRESAGEVLQHDDLKDEVTVKIVPVGQESPIELTKRLEEVRLLESRRSPRLADQDKDTDFARLADMAGDRRRQSHNIDVPFSLTQQNGSRKRRPSFSPDDREYYSINDDDPMDECNAALVLMSLSCSPIANVAGWETILGTSPGSSSTSWSTGSASPPLSDDERSNLLNKKNNGHGDCTGNNNDVAIADHNNTATNGTTNEIVIRGIRTTSLSNDEGIGMEYEEIKTKPKRRPGRPIFLCTWKGCGAVFALYTEISAHVRELHIGPRGFDEGSDEEDFFFTEIEDEADSFLVALHPPSPPTLSHRDMARPPHEDPEYQREIVGNYRQGLLSMATQQQQQQLQQQQQQQQQQHHVQHHLQHQQMNAAIKPPLPAATGHQQQPLHHHHQSLNNNNNNNNNIVGQGSNSNGSTGSNNSSSNGSGTVHPHTSPLLHHSYSWSQVSPTSPQKHVRLSPRPSSTYPYPSPNYSNQIAQQQHYQQQQQQQQHLSQIQLSPGATPYQPAIGGGAITPGGGQVQPINGAGAYVAPGTSPGTTNNRSPLSPNRRTRGENKKCRKVYGMDHKEQWCTQCKWKKACSRFGD
ncbi:zinc finger protein 704-like isoform X2 [Toxorhynchites rutilus septentrionalis]|uniref:zinc finger protein 704-like isoform X2 n=1 Tax=Toxorhynchites rutilus septentrionalis TaxID=329112 RepID=UPI002479520E|nr:zinc finger protein 704-like isoform X2 [Toxorhynchites rutilus septentrionalis]